MIKKYNPTTASRRHMTNVDFSPLTRGIKRLKLLTTRLKTHAGRNNRGCITMRHQGGGHKKLYRIIDFKQDRFDIPAVVESLEYDPYRTAFIARIVYRDGLRSYILASKNMKVGDEVVTSLKALVKEGNRLPLKSIPVGYLVHNVEMQRGTGGKLVRSAGSSAQILAQGAGYTDIKLLSREVRKIHWEALATLGEVSNSEWSLVHFGKAGRSRWFGIRPTVRGSAMNPVDHPYGGGEGRQRRGTRRPKDTWGNITGGRKTRNPRKWSNGLIIKRRSKKNSK